MPPTRHTFETILDHRPAHQGGKKKERNKNKTRNAVEYLIEWEGLNPETGQPWDNTWEPSENITKAGLEEYYTRLLAHPSPPRHRPPRVAKKPFSLPQDKATQTEDEATTPSSPARVPSTPHRQTTPAQSHPFAGPSVPLDHPAWQRHGPSAARGSRAPPSLSTLSPWTGGDPVMLRPGLEDASEKKKKKKKKKRKARMRETDSDVPSSPSPALPRRLRPFHEMMRGS